MLRIKVNWIQWYLPVIPPFGRQRSRRSQLRPAQAKATEISSQQMN
jgi:hypothetical protein